MPRFSRFEKLVQTNGLQILADKVVLVLGCGGVGSYVVEALARSGVGKLILIDFDVIDETNINRQIMAFDSTIGKKKIDILAQRVYDINPQCSVIKIGKRIDCDNLNEMFSYSIDFFVDACDTVKTKMHVITACLERKIPFLSCMGTGNRFDPSLLEITDIRKTQNDPLARVIRKYVKDQGIREKVLVLASLEVPIKTGDRVPGSTAFVPASAGLLIASYVVRYFLADGKSL